MDSPSHSLAGLATLVGVALALGARTSMGVGNGWMNPGNSPVSSWWTSKDAGTTGTMTATLGDGSSYSGPFYLNDAAAGMGGGGQGEGQFSGGPTVSAVFTRS